MDFPPDDFTMADLIKHPQRDQWLRDVLRFIHQAKRIEFITPEGDRRFPLYSQKSTNMVVDLRKLGTSVAPIPLPSAPVLTVTPADADILERLVWTTTVGNFEAFYIERSPVDESAFVPLTTLTGLTRYFLLEDGVFFRFDDGGRLILEQGLAVTMVGPLFQYSFDDVFASADGIEYFYRVRGLRNGIYSDWSNVESGVLAITHIDLVGHTGTPLVTYSIVGATGSLAIAAGMATAGTSASYQWKDPGGANYDNSHALWPYGGVHIQGTGATVASFDISVGVPHAIADGTYNASINLIDAAGSMGFFALTGPNNFTVLGGRIVP